MWPLADRPLDHADLNNLTMIQMKALNTPTPAIAKLAWRSATLAARWPD
jgi:hypothetical protein